MTTAFERDSPSRWWKEPTRDQWMAYLAAWLGWTLGAFAFTLFPLIMVPIANGFGVPLAAVAVVFTITLWMRLLGAVASGWLAFCYHPGAIRSGFTVPVRVWFAGAYGLSLAIAMLIGTVGGLISFSLAVLCGPQTKGNVLAADLGVA
jgi:hypothetical protein